VTTERVVRITLEVVSVGATLYMVWVLIPESTKMELRAAAREMLAPFDAVAARRRTRVEMMADVIELSTFGVPAQWAAHQT
jgi:hypothetical protein